MDKVSLELRTMVENILYKNVMKQKEIEKRHKFKFMSAKFFKAPYIGNVPVAPGPGQ